MQRSDEAVEPTSVEVTSSSAQEKPKKKATSGIKKASCKASLKSISKNNDAKPQTAASTSSAVSDSTNNDVEKDPESFPKSSDEVEKKRPRKKIHLPAFLEEDEILRKQFIRKFNSRPTYRKQLKHANYIDGLNMTVFGTGARKRLPDEDVGFTWFTGGSASPFTSEKDFKVFARHLAEDVIAGRTFFLNETAANCRVFAEFDYEHPDAMTTHETMVKDALAFQSIVKLFFEDSKTTDFTMWVLVRRHSGKWKQNLPLPIVTGGMHVVFPNLCVTPANLQRIMVYAHANHLKVDLLPSAKARPSLRPVYASKMNDCFKCFKVPEKQQNCNACKTSGRVPDHVPYFPYMKIDSDGKEIERGLNASDPGYNVDYVARIYLETTIHHFRALDAGFKVPHGAPTAVPVLTRNGQNVKKMKYSNHDRKIASNKFEPSDAARAKIKEVIMKLHPMYNDDKVIIGEVSLRKKTVMLIQMTGYGKHTCFIKYPQGGDHTNQNIFFLVDRSKRTISQMCYSCSKTTKKPGLCVLLTNEIMNIMMDREGEV